MKDKQSNNGKKDRNILKLITLLGANPAMTHEEQAKELDVSVETLIREYHKKGLEANGLAIINPVILTKNFESKLQRVWIFIETTFAHNHENAVQACNYQGVLSKNIKKIIADDFTDKIVLESIDVVLGGDWDIILTLRCKDQRLIHRLVTQRIRVARHVLRTSTCFAEPIHDLE